MYLSDHDLHDLLPRLNIQAEDNVEPFNPDENIQPASIDFRLSCRFWRPLKRFTIDLRRPQLLEIQPRRYYRVTNLLIGDTIILKPNELLLGRTSEEFSIPNGYAGEITGRSSFSRLGLMVNSTGGFINPGWHGRMPIQLYNFGPNSIRITPGLPICQLRVVKVTTISDRPYGDVMLQSNYVDDDGGPSYWWRDKRIKALHSLLSQKTVEGRIQTAIYKIIGNCEPEVIERLEVFVKDMRLDQLQNADTILDAFAHKENRRRSIRRWLIHLFRASFSVAIGASLWIGNKPPIQMLHHIVWFISFCIVILSLYAFRTEVGDHFGITELHRCRA